MDENIISIFARGNQELFHSAFLAWLMRPTAPHALGDEVLRAVFSRLPPSHAPSISGGCEVRIEFTEGRSRFDIIVQPIRSGPEHKGTVLENKVKSFGNHLQLDAYKARGYNVALFALLPETLDSDTRAKYPVIEYATLLEIIRSLVLDGNNPYHFIIAQYAEFVERTLQIFSLLRKMADGSLDTNIFLRALATAVKGSEFSDNDIRTFSYFYYHNFAEYLRTYSPDLWFGDAEYADAEKSQLNTRWLFEKNMQGPPFMECILFNPTDSRMSWKLHPAFADLYRTNSFQIAPRVELWLDPTSMTDPNDDVGKIMLGTWSDEFKTLLGTDPYKSSLTAAGARNFHREVVPVRDLPFKRLADRIRFMLAMICDGPNSAVPPASAK